jgi:hypothetical protein
MNSAKYLLVTLSSVLFGAACSSSPTDTTTDTVATDVLVSMKKGQVVYDSEQLVYWLADANLAHTAASDPQLALPGITASGAMDFNTALAFVAALNSYNNGPGSAPGWLGHHDWQLPTTPQTDGSCSVASGPQGNSFGMGCTDNAMGYLYTVLLAPRTSPSPIFRVIDNTPPTKNPPFLNLQPGFYWTQGAGGTSSGHQTYSFATGDKDSNVDDNVFYVLPRRAGMLSTPPHCPTRTSLVPYQTSFVYQCSTGFVWLADANLAASQKLGFGPPQMAVEGGMRFATAFGDPTKSPPTLGWIDAMNGKISGVAAPFPGISDWQLPASHDELDKLYTDLKYMAGDSVNLTTEPSGLFVNIQPSQYWSCKRADDTAGGTNQSPCLCTDASCPAADHAGVDPHGTLNPDQDFAFDFEDGFLDTTDDPKPRYVMVYYPQKIAPPPSTMKCTSPMTCCGQAGGSWGGGECQ